MFNSKTGFLFTLDIVLCIVIIVLGFLLAWSSLSAEPPKEQPYLLADSIASLMVDTKNYEVLDKITTLDVRTEVETNHNLENSMWEQIGMFYLSTNPAADDWARDYVRDTLNKSLLSQYSMQITFNKESIYNQTTGTLGLNQSEAPFIVVSKRLVLLIVNETELKGPYVGEVRIW